MLDIELEIKTAFTAFGLHVYVLSWAKFECNVRNKSLTKYVPHLTTKAKVTEQNADEHSDQVTFQRVIRAWLQIRSY